ncbi:MAG: ferric reductase-like transmembrane domain-containing protein [Phycisphaeraceae bacterium]
MNAIVKHAVRWVLLYIVVVMAPLWMMLAEPLPAGRYFGVEFGVALGFLGLALMCVQFLLTGRFWQVGKPFGVDTILQFHRQAGIIAVIFVIGHVVVLLAARPGYWAFFDPRVNAPRALALVMALVAMIALVVLSLRRRTFGLSYEWWRLTHGLLAALVLFIGLAHVNMVGHYVATPFKRGVWIAGVGAALGLLIYIRIVKPWQTSRRPWRVTDVQPERGESWSLTLEAEGHAGMPFNAGQYAWLTLGPTPWTLQQHPFSFSSSAAEPTRVRLTIKELGDFTGTIGKTSIGTRAYLEGPYGQFLLPRREPTVMIAGGIGITPFLSMLRTEADTADHQTPYYLFYGVPTLDRAIGHEELTELEQLLPALTIVYVVDRPDEQWQGERGYVTRELLQRHLPEHEIKRLRYMACGPDIMLDMVNAELSAMGVPQHRQRSERFNIV